MATAKKTAAKKTTAKKTESTKKEKSESTDESESVKEIAKQVIAGEWNSGRERDILLTEAGHDPRAVQTEVAKQLSER